jgi:hypothetical protein
MNYLSDKETIVCPPAPDMTGEGPHGDKHYHFWSSHISTLEGQLLTLVEATVDIERTKAVKDIIRKLVWDWAEDTSYCRRCDNRKRLDCREKCPKTTHAHYCPDCNCFDYGPKEAEPMINVPIK